MKTEGVENKALLKKIKVISNENRFRILELTQNEQLSITKLSFALGLTYTKCSDYVKMLEDGDLVTKTKDGKNILVKSSVKISKDQIMF